MAKSKPTPNSGHNAGWALKALSTVVKEVGIAGALVVFAMFFLIIYATTEQKQRFIDTWLLLQGESHVPCILIIIFVTSIAIIGGIYFKTMLNMTKAENIRIGQEKSDLQERLLQGNLSTSKKTKKS